MTTVSATPRLRWGQAFAGPPVFGDQPVVEVFEGQGMADPGTGSFKQGLAHPEATMTGGFAVSDRAAPPGLRRQADNSGDLLGAE